MFSISLNQLYLAYRKTKHELFNDRNSLTTLKLLEYEENLTEHLESLKTKIENLNFDDIQVEGYFDIPKSLDIDSKEKEKAHFFSNSKKHFDNVSTKDNVKFRRVLDSSIDFHIVSALWVEEVGQHLDALLSKHAYGSRLERINCGQSSECSFEEDRQYNLHSPKIFRSYQHQYQQWRDKGFKAIEELHGSSSVIALTMDISSFFHTINLKEFHSKVFYKLFGLNKIFRKKLELQKFHEGFIDLIKRWNKNAELDKGLPIGLSASPILANASMATFDRDIETKLSPVYYGRYVDDIILVLADPGGIECASDVSKYLVEKKNIKCLKFAKKLANNASIIYKTYYQTLEFNSGKQKIFFLDQASDLSMIEAIKSEIQELSSEWRFMSDLADNNSKLLAKVMGFYSDETEFNDALRKTDEVVLKRLGFSLLLSHSYALNEFVSPKEWEGERTKVYDLMEGYLLQPKYFVSYFNYVPLVFKLMLTSEDYDRAICYLKEVLGISENLSKAELISSNATTVKPSALTKLIKQYCVQIVFEVINYTSSITEKELTVFNDLVDLEGAFHE